MKTDILTKICIILIVSSFVCTSLIGTTHNKPAQPETVYICTGQESTVYHKTQECEELHACGTTIIPTDIKNMQKVRTKCKKCFANNSNIAK